jgi:hypothetical protein
MFVPYKQDIEDFVDRWIIAISLIIFVPMITLVITEPHNPYRLLFWAVALAAGYGALMDVVYRATRRLRGRLYPAAYKFCVGFLPSLTGVVLIQIIRGNIFASDPWLYGAVLVGAALGVWIKGLQKTPDRYRRFEKHDN